ncbi:MAG: hypothetical protein ACI9U2_005206, partial [Bradymonadia bacterium]
MGGDESFPEAALIALVEEGIYQPAKRARQLDRRLQDRKADARALPEHLRRVLHRVV